MNGTTWGLKGRRGPAKCHEGEPVRGPYTMGKKIDILIGQNNWNRPTNERLRSAELFSLHVDVFF